jgi:mRNA interferase HigB
MSASGRNQSEVPSSCNSDRGVATPAGRSAIFRIFASAGRLVADHLFILGKRAGHRGIKAARAQYEAWRAIVERSQWKTPEDVKKAHPKASILKSGRVVFNIKANDYRLIALVQYAAGVLMIRFFGSHEDYDRVDAESV